jgi:hypothetical protein
MGFSITYKGRAKGEIVEFIYNVGGVMENPKVCK